MSENLQAAPSVGDPNCYSESLARLDRQVDHIPLGWQRLYGDLRHALRALETPSRMNARIDGAWHEDGMLCVDSEASDAAIQGVLRKARIRARHTCTECGRPGKRRELVNWEEATLCGRCAAPRLLSLDIDRVLALENCGSVELRVELQQAPEAALIRAAAEAAATEHGLRKNFILSQLTEEQLRAWLKRLRAVADENRTAEDN
jgi:ribosomal protein L18